MMSQDRDISKMDASYAHSDLALECAGGADLSEEKRGGCTVTRLFVSTRQSEERYGKPRGHYVTLECGRIWEFDDERTECVSEVLSGELVRMCRAMCGRAPDRDFGILVAGLGNGDITADAIGPETVRRIEVTRHLRSYLPDAYRTLGVCAVSALAPGVLGQTGIETVELVRGAAGNAAPDLIIAIDALAARSVSRLATTVQLSDNGINPGSGIGNTRRAISRETVGVPVLALGVPTVVSSATLVYDALREAGVGHVSRELRQVLEQGRDFFVSPKESDVIVKKVAALLARAIGMACTVPAE